MQRFLAVILWCVVSQIISWLVLVTAFASHRFLLRAYSWRKKKKNKTVIPYKESGDFTGNLGSYISIRSQDYLQVQTVQFVFHSEHLFSANSYSRYPWKWAGINFKVNSSWQVRPRSVPCSPSSIPHSGIKRENQKGNSNKTKPTNEMNKQQANTQTQILMN